MVDDSRQTPPRIFFVDWIKHRRLTQRRVADLMGASTAKISKLATGDQQWTQLWLQKAADALGIDVTALFSPPNPDQDMAPGVVPIVSWVSAGLFQRDDLAQDILGTIHAPDLPPGDWIALRVDGDSMDRISPPGSIIFVDRSDTKLIPNGCYIIVDGEGCATYKRFRAGPPRFEPVSVNREHETFYIDGDNWPAVAGRVKRSVIEM